MLTDKYPRIVLSHTPTPVECLSNLSKVLGGPEIWIKRDDCTGLAMGGNKTRQLEYYFGEAKEQNADTIVITGAVQSNFVRCAVAAARKSGMQAEVQLEERTPNQPPEYYQSGNPLLVRLMGAKIHSYPNGEDEVGADKALFDLADKLRQDGRQPYVITLSESHAPLGALGYVDCAEELLAQFAEQKLNIDGIVVASGSGATHAGLIAGLRARGSAIPVYGMCVRRDQVSQQIRMIKKTQILCEMIEQPNAVNADDIWLDDTYLRPGYGQLNDSVMACIHQVASLEGIILDPVYTGKAMAGLINLVTERYFDATQKILFIHTGGAPSVFGYPDLVSGRN